MSSEVTLGLKIDLRITAQDIREPIFAYYHELERCRENHGQADDRRQRLDVAQQSVRLRRGAEVDDRVGSQARRRQRLAHDEAVRQLGSLPLDDRSEHVDVEGLSEILAAKARPPEETK